MCIQYLCILVNTQSTLYVYPLMCIRVQMYMCTYVHAYIYIYIYIHTHIYTQRERERELHVYVTCLEGLTEMMHRFATDSWSMLR